MIPARLHRTVPEHHSLEIDRWWDEACKLHPDWLHFDHAEPLDPIKWHLTSAFWDRCENGAQKAGLIRLEALYRYGGVYIDSDVEVFRPLDSLLHCRGFAAWEDERCVPDAVMGFERQHPAVGEMIILARKAVANGDGAWLSGPGVTTKVLPGRDDVLLLPPGSLYQVHYLEKRRLKDPAKPWEFVRHHWHFSWGTPAQKAANERRQR